MHFHGTIIWNELMTSDVEAAKAFYGAVLGWTFETVDSAVGPYTLARRPGEPRPVAGFMPWAAATPGAEDWFAYAGVDDVAAAVAAVRAAGGTVHRDVFDIAGVGTFAIVADPVGAVIGLMKPLPM
ncbi:VOC family protein [Siculibacillus lacustris]|uniref:VOC family protein n=1 Tax=Siculibacillus lacustris TaxID=1549641 RepID=A0A4Q9VTD3_9HYPH|nr:VOC family protein [Siculibacillus lacustris]TBW39200.1 VOC family protein [Siculibacillus lacustris]